ncbi:MAG TPA: dephospho-CoA kinase [Terracidiphilus sp.]|jgi:dephospho-CoA kinase
MLRVGLTGGLGSGKSTVAAELRRLGAHVIEADELGRELMEPGQAVYEEIVRQFGPGVVGGDGRLNRARLAEMAFNEGRLEELNAIVHPAVIGAQQRWMEGVFAQDSNAVAVVESALIFEVERDAKAREANLANSHAGGARMGHPDGEMGTDSLLLDWRNRFDRIIVLTAPDEVKVARYADRLATDPAKREAVLADARVRLSRQIPDAEKAARADFVIENTGGVGVLRKRVAEIWEGLLAASS